MRAKARSRRKRHDVQQVSSPRKAPRAQSTKRKAVAKGKPRTPTNRKVGDQVVYVQIDGWYPHICRGRIIEVRDRSNKLNQGRIWYRIKNQYNHVKPKDHYFTHVFGENEFDKAKRFAYYTVMSIIKTLIDWVETYVP